MEKTRLVKHLAVTLLLLVSLLWGTTVVVNQLAGSSFPAANYLSRTWTLDASGTPDLARSDLSNRSTWVRRPTPLPTPVAPPAWGLSWPLPIRGALTTLYGGGHWAVDIGAPCGTPVLVADAGTVVWAGRKDNGGGLVVDVLHNWATGVIITSYNHMSAISVVLNQVLLRGQQVGLVGNTGHAIGCHLHWGVAVDGRWYNPLDFLAR